MPNGEIMVDSIRQLIESRTESANHDFKAAMNWGNLSRPEKWDLVKDALAMANTRDGGKIIIGVNDDFTYSEMTEEEQQSFDVTSFNNFFHRYTEPTHSCGVNLIEVDGHRLVVISVPAFNDTPIICNRDADTTLRAGAIYIRHDDASSREIRTAHQTRELMGRALVRRGDTLLREINQLLAGRPLIPETVENPYREELQALSAFLSERISINSGEKGTITIVAYPSNRAERRFDSRELVRESVRDAEVRLRGWSFPHIDQDNSSNYEGGFQSYTDWRRFVEAFRASLSGIFGYREVLKEDIMFEDDQDGKYLEFVWLILSVTEYFFFMSRYYAYLDIDEQVVIKFYMNNTQGRQLFSYDNNRRLDGIYICQEPVVRYRIQRTVAQLRTDYKEIAREVVREVYSMFNCPIEDGIIENWQDRLFNQTL